jgi:hypothetical protein
MKAENKKLLIYAGSAIAVGAVAFFVYEFFKKPKQIDLGATKIKIGGEEVVEDELKTPSSTEPPKFQQSFPAFKDWNFNDALKRLF